MKETDIEEDINICNEIIRTNMFNRHTDAQAIKNILADRERLIEMLKKSDTENIELQKEIEELKNDTYWKRIYSKTK